jgi:cytochrome b involved in lipid metabolism
MHACCTQVYDLTSWVDTHPGGKEVLLLMGGRDATAAFESYHPFTDKPKKLIGKFEIGAVKDYEFPQYRPDSGFYAETNKRLAAYFKENKLNPKDPWPGVWRMILVRNAHIYMCINPNHSSYCLQSHAFIA